MLENIYFLKLKRNLRFDFHNKIEGQIVAVEEIVTLLVEAGEEVISYGEVDEASQ